jgi:N-acetylglucosaminyldiphosphoundecaprenol N-acetyl-beta-D-mannosaminyltransferase
MNEALEILDGMAAARRGGQIVTVNPEFIMEALVNPTFRRVLNRATLAVPDGTGIVWAARILGTRMRERVTGVDLLQNFPLIAARKGYRLFLLGAAPGVAEKAASILQERHPGLVIAGTFSGSPRKEDEEEIRTKILAAAPDLLFVAYGSPQQELWIERNAPGLRLPVCIGVGGAFDFTADVVPRAPAVMQKLGIEWLFRLWQQPSRWRRMMVLPKFALLVIGTRFLGWNAIGNDNAEVP